MRYMLLIHGNQRGANEIVASWSKQDLKAMVGYMHALDDDLRATGELIDDNGLQGPAHAKTVRAQADGKPVVTDGVYPEGKDFLFGYWVVDVKTSERAIEIAARISATPGPGGIPVNQAVEVHPIGQAPDVD
jgi:hypothetical protein